MHKAHYIWESHTVPGECMWSERIRVHDIVNGWREITWSQNCVSTDRSLDRDWAFYAYTSVCQSIFSIQNFFAISYTPGKSCPWESIVITQPPSASPSLRVLHAIVLCGVLQAHLKPLALENLLCLMKPRETRAFETFCFQKIRSNLTRLSHRPIRGHFICLRKNRSN